ncbi:hypothetical protein D5S17_35865 [Pseudonocardiaceae bacterium YIM PH 21723]|nr:hypothetical protein D5S17_35865 [Pseudonocardiaceae bacterium YIM PH 21723]
MNFRPWTDLQQWSTYLDADHHDPQCGVDPAAVPELARHIERKYLGIEHHQAVAVTGEEPGLSATVAAAVRENWQQIPGDERPKQHPVWWSAPAGLKPDRLVRALAEHLGSPVARGHNDSSWITRLLWQQQVPVLILSGLSAMPVARSEHNSLPRFLAYLVKHTRTLFVFVDPEAERVLFDAPAGIELATRTTLLTVPGPSLIHDATPGLAP